MGTQLVEMDAKKHDEAMQIVQVMRHLTTFVYGQFLAKQTHSLTEIKSCSSPIYQLELMMVVVYLLSHQDYMQTLC